MKHKIKTNSSTKYAMPRTYCTVSHDAGHRTNARHNNHSTHTHIRKTMCSLLMLIACISLVLNAFGTASVAVYADTVYAGTVYTDTVYADTVYADTVYTDTVYADTVYAGTTDDISLLSSPLERQEPYKLLVSTASDMYEFPAPPQIESGNCILMDADSGIVLYEKNSDEKCYPASVTKLMTALLVVENANLNDTLTVSSSAVSSVKYGDATAGLKTGEEFTVEQALNMMLIKSANDIAYALGEHVGGSIANFANMMNKKAAELGCLNTHFTNASGLTDVNHYTTAYDMALICRAVLDYPAIMNAISYTKSYSVPPTNKTSDTRYYRLSHSMVTGKYLYEYCIGGKTGYTDAAGHTLATFAQKDGIRLICVVFNSTDDQRYIDTTALFEYGFNNFHKLNISQNEDTFSFNQGLGLADFGISGKALNVSSDISLSVSDTDSVIIPVDASFGDLTKEIIYHSNVETSGIDTPDNKSASSDTASANKTSASADKASSNNTAESENTTASGKNISSNILADINYYYGDNLVGHTSLCFSGTASTGMTSDDSVSADEQTASENTSGLPYLTSDTSNSPLSNAVMVTGHFIFINIWLFISIVCALLLVVILLVINAKKNRHSLRF